MSEDINELKSKIKKLEKENILLRKGITSFLATGKTVSTPKELEPLFDQAEQLVKSYFTSLKANPSEGRIEIQDERYVLLRASSLSVGFFNKIKDLYKDKGEAQSFTIGRNFLFDISHVLGIEDAKNFHEKMGLKEPIEKLSVGPVHFAYTGWASVDLLEGSNPVPGEDFIMRFNHPFSFEADSWVREGVRANFPVCIMNSGYSSGWCEESFGIPLTTVEITCKAKGDSHCSFIMAPPHRIQEYLGNKNSKLEKLEYDIPSFFERKHTEEKLNSSLAEKEILLKEIHHRVKNNLQVVSSLLNLQSHFLKDEKTKHVFQETKNRIKTLALVHEKLFNSEDVEYVDLGEYIKSIIELLSYSYDKEYIDIHYDIDAESFNKFDMEKAIPCGLFVNEVTSNSYKYAFPLIKNGRIHISLQKKTDKIHLILADDGIGFPAGFDMHESNSLGMELIHSLASQLEGELSISKEKGVRYELVFE